jgi:hypothetical protein
MSSAAPKTNGKAKKVTQCPHADECSVTEAAARSLSLIDARLESIDARFERWALHLSDVAQRQTVTDQREERWLQTLGEIEKKLAALLPKEA